MDSPNKNIDELLSSMLDGRLSKVEFAELEREMEKNPSLKGVLNALAVQRRSLLSGRSPNSLRSDFASSVSHAAKKRAAEMGGNAPAWLASPDTVQIKRPFDTNSRDSDSGIRWMVAGGLALAATLLFVFMSFPNVKTGGIATVPGVDEIASNDTVTGKDLAESANLPPNKLEVPDPKKLQDGKFNTDLIAQSNPATESVASNQPSDVLGPQKEVNGKGAFNTSDAVAVADVLNQGADSIRGGLDSSLKTKDKQQLPAQKQKPFYTMVLDVSIDPQAVENRTLERILEKYNIVYTDDLVVSDEQLKNLEDSKIVGNVANTGEKMGVMFLRSTAKKLDLAITDIINQYEEFPEFALDVTTDKSAVMLVSQLSSIKVADGAGGFANRLTVGRRRGNQSPFTASAKRGKPMSNTSREKFNGGMIPANSDRDEMSNVLFLLRPAKK